MDWTEHCRNEFPDDAGYLDYPFKSGDTLDTVVGSEDDEETDDDV